MLTVKRGSETASARFQKRHIGVETAYTHRVGLSLVFSDRMKKTESWIHELHMRVFASTVSLGEVEEDLRFLRLLRKGARMSRDNESEATPVEDWGEPLTRLGEAVESLARVAEFLELDMKQFYLADFRDEEFCKSMFLLDALLLRDMGFERLFPAFIINEAVDQALESTPTDSVLMELPVVLNLRDTGIVIWVRARGEAFRSKNDMWCGLRVREQLALSYEIRQRFRKSHYPEVWIVRYWPPLRVGEFHAGTRAHALKIARDYITIEASIWRETAETA